MNKTVQDLKMETETVRNHKGRQPWRWKIYKGFGVTDAAEYKRWKRHGRISGIEDIMEDNNRLAKEKSNESFSGFVQRLTTALNIAISDPNAKNI